MESLTLSQAAYNAAAKLSVNSSSVQKSSIPHPQISHKRRRNRCRSISISSEVVETSSASTGTDSASTSTERIFESSKKAASYPGGIGPYTGRDPTVKKPSWLRQRAPQGERFQELKDSLTTLKLNTVCEEAQCPNIGEVRQCYFRTVSPLPACDELTLCGSWRVIRSRMIRFTCFRYAGVLGLVRSF